MKLLVSGAAGRTALEFVRRYGSSYTLRLSDREIPEEADLQEAGQWMSGDPADVDFARDLVAEMEMAVQIAGEAGDREGLETWLPEDALAIGNLFQAARDAGLRRMVFVSSTQEHPATAEERAEAVNLRGALRAWGEALCSVYSAKGMPSVAVRTGSAGEGAEVIHQMLVAGDLNQAFSPGSGEEPEGLADMVWDESNGCLPGRVPAEGGAGD